MTLRAWLLSAAVGIAAIAPVGSNALSRDIHVSESGEQVERRVTLKYIIQGTLFVNAQPWADVYINGVKKGQTPSTIKLAPGTYRLTLKNPSCEEHSETIQIESGKTLKRSVKLILK